MITRDDVQKLLDVMAAEEGVLFKKFVLKADTVPAKLGFIKVTVSLYAIKRVDWKSEETLPPAIMKYWGGNEFKESKTVLIKDKQKAIDELSVNMLKPFIATTIHMLDQYEDDRRIECEQLSEADDPFALD